MTFTYSAVFLYQVYGVFFNFRVYFDMIVRVLSYLFVIGMYTQLQKKRDEDYNLSMTVAFNFILLSVSESFFFSLYKSKAKLFLKIKVSMLQQDQLFNLLDSVPDKVMICKYQLESLKPKQIYRNNKMSKFLN